MPEDLLWVGLNPEMPDMIYATVLSKLSEYFERVGYNVFRIKDNIYLKVRYDEIRIYVCDNEYLCP